ncbi:MAG: hypothetical protein WCC32_13815, partial [Terriglobales bacterium]
AMDFPSREPADAPTSGHIMSSANESHSELSVSAADSRSFEDRSFDESFASAASTSGLAYSSNATQSIPVDSMHTGVEHAPTPAAFNSQQGEVISLDGMRMSAPTYQAEDLDVPAFLRKRNDVM